MKEIPLFPLPLVLFPGGRLPLQIFEVRYLDMVKSCMRENSGFGVVMLETGGEVFDGLTPNRLAQEEQRTKREILTRVRLLLLHGSFFCAYISPRQGLTYAYWFRSDNRNGSGSP